MALHLHMGRSYQSTFYMICRIPKNRLSFQVIGVSYNFNAPPEHPLLPDALRRTMALLPARPQRAARTGVSRRVLALDALF